MTLPNEASRAALPAGQLAHLIFPPMPDPPPGFVLRTTPTRVLGVGPWED